MAGYIIQDKQGNAIFGFGWSVDAAWAMVRDGAGPFFDAYGDEISDEVAFTTKFRAYPATDDLIKAVADLGGDISWRITKDGVADLPEPDQDWGGVR